MNELSVAEIHASVKSLKPDLRGLRLEHIAEMVRTRVFKAQGQRGRFRRQEEEHGSWRLDPKALDADPLEVLLLSTRARKLILELNAETMRCAKLIWRRSRFQNCYRTMSQNRSKTIVRRQEFRSNESGYDGIEQ